MLAADTSAENTGLRAGFTIGRVINVFIILIFFASLISSLVVIGSLNTLHRNVQPDYKAHYIDYTNSSATAQIPHFCELYSSYHTADPTTKSNFTFNSQYSCEFIIATNGILVATDVVLVVIAVIRIILALNLHCTVFVEFGALFVATVFAFILGVTLSIGVDITCDAVASFYSSSCMDKFLPFTQVEFYPVLNVTQAAMWFNFLFLFILTVIFIVRMVLYLRRQVRGSAVLHNASKEEYDPILENKDSAMTRPVSRTV